MIAAITLEASAKEVKELSKFNSIDINILYYLSELKKIKNMNNPIFRLNSLGD